MHKFIEATTLPALYTTFWLLIHFYFLGDSFPVYSFLVSVGYGTGHYLAQKHRGHIALSADSLAVPIAFTIVFISILIASIFQVLPQQPEAYTQTTINLTLAFIMSFTGGHAFTMLSVFFFSTIFERFEKHTER